MTLSEKYELLLNAGMHAVYNVITGDYLTFNDGRWYLGGEIYEGIAYDLIIMQAQRWKLTDKKVNEVLDQIISKVTE